MLQETSRAKRTVLSRVLSSAKAGRLEVTYTRQGVESTVPLILSFDARGAADPGMSWAVPSWPSARVNLGGALRRGIGQTGEMIGLVVKSIAPSYTSDAAATAVVVSRIDRWGNIIEHVDARGYATQAFYNDRNQAIRQIGALVKVVSETGVETWIRPETRWMYDALGRLTKNRRLSVCRRTMSRMTSSALPPAPGFAAETKAVPTAKKLPRWRGFNLTQKVHARPSGNPPFGRSVFPRPM